MSRYIDNHLKYKTKYLNMKGGYTKEIYLIRHGQTEWNRLGKGQGQEADIPLNDIGKEESHKTGQYLEKFRILDKQFDCIYASPMLRTKETANIIKNIIKFEEDIIYEDDLKERKQGKLSGLTKSDPFYPSYKKLRDELMPTDPIEKYKEHSNIMTMISNKLDIGMENDRDLEDRAYRIISKIVDSKHNKIMVISHGGLLLAMIRKLFNIIRSPEGDFTNGDNCWIAYLTYNNKEYKLLSPPNTEHLSL